VDGIRLDQFHPGRQYVLGNSLGALFLAEGWAEPVEDDEPSPVIPPTKFTDKKYSDELRLRDFPRNISTKRVLPAIAADRRRPLHRRRL
jgi:hypothetical protein